MDRLFQPNAFSAPPMLTETNLVIPLDEMMLRFDELSPMLNSILLPAPKSSRTVTKKHRTADRRVADGDEDDDSTDEDFVASEPMEKPRKRKNTRESDDDGDEEGDHSDPDDEVAGDSDSAEKEADESKPTDPKSKTTVDADVPTAAATEKQKKKKKYGILEVSAGARAGDAL